MAIHHELNDENFATTYESHTDHIRGVLTNRGCPGHLLQDLCQEVALRLWAKRQMYSPAKGRPEILDSEGHRKRLV
jgi:DNA-directed RNA polymerase specialized sigma24 family protein